MGITPPNNKGKYPLKIKNLQQKNFLRALCAFLILNILWNFGGGKQNLPLLTGFRGGNYPPPQTNFTPGVKILRGGGGKTTLQRATHAILPHPQKSEITPSKNLTPPQKKSLDAPAPWISFSIYITTYI